MVVDTSRTQIIHRNKRARNCDDGGRRRCKPSYIASNKHAFNKSDPVVLGGLIPTYIAKRTVMGPAHRFRSAPPRAHASTPSDPLAPPPFNGEGNPMEWARQVTDWERGHDTLCAGTDKRGFPKALRGYLLSRALSGTALRTVKGTLSQDVIHSEKGVDEIVKLLAKFNPTTAAHGIFTAYKALLQIRRRQKESFKLYVNRFEAAASELRDLTGQEKNGEAEQLLAFQLLEGAQIPTAVYLQLLTNCIALGREIGKKSEPSSAKEILPDLEQVIRSLENGDSKDLSKQLEGIKDDKAKAIKETFNKQVNDAASKLEDVLARLKEEPLFEKKASPGHPIALNLESAIDALRGLDAISAEGDQASANNELFTSKAQQEDIRRIVRQTLLAHKERPTTRSKPGNGKGKRTDEKKRAARRAQIAKWKTESPCRDCNQKGHWAGDPECPMSKGRAGGSKPPLSETMLGSAQQDPEAGPSDAPVFFH